MVRLLSISRRGSNAARLPKQASSLTAGSWSSVDSVVLNLISPAAHTKRGSSSSVELERRRVRFFCSKFAMDKAAQGGHMSVLQLLHDQVGRFGTGVQDGCRVIRLALKIWRDNNHHESRITTYDRME